jgi:hypothetical protein
MSVFIFFSWAFAKKKKPLHYNYLLLYFIFSFSCPEKNLLITVFYMAEAEQVAGEAELFHGITTVTTKLRETLDANLEPYTRLIEDLAHVVHVVRKVAYVVLQLTITRFYESLLPVDDVMVPDQDHFHRVHLFYTRLKADSTLLFRAAMMLLAQPAANQGAVPVLYYSVQQGTTMEQYILQYSEVQNDFVVYLKQAVNILSNRDAIRHRMAVFFPDPARALDVMQHLQTHSYNTIQYEATRMV